MGTALAPEIAIRLSADALRLEVYIPAACGEPAAVLLQQIQTRCTALELRLPRSNAALEADLLTAPRDCWHTICVGEPATPPVDGSLELALPIPVLSARQPLGRRRQVVSAGEVLARRRPGVPGREGRDLRGRAIPVHPPREVALPGGENTVPSADGLLLLACCDGEAVLRNLHITVLPMRVHRGDISAQDGLLTVHDSLLITGSVLDHARVEADGEIYVQGDVRGGRLWSVSSTITVLGATEGSSPLRAELRAYRDIVCGPATHAKLTAGGDLWLRAPARQSALRVGRGVYLPDTLERSLEDVTLQVEGGLFPPRATLERPQRYAPRRQHVRVATRLPAMVAIQGVPPLQYRSCTLRNLSVAGARCEMVAKDVRLLQGSIVQLRLMLADSKDSILLLAYVARVTAPGSVGLNFIQMTQRDRDRLTTFCLQLLLRRGHNQVALPPLNPHPVRTAS